MRLSLHAMNATTHITSQGKSAVERPVLTANYRGPIHGRYIALSTVDSAIARTVLPSNGQNRAVCFAAADLPNMRALFSAEGIALEVLTPTAIELLTPFRQL